MAEKPARSGAAKAALAPADSPDELVRALRQAQASPADEAAWDALEQIAADLQRPEEVAALYGVLLDADLSPEIASPLGRRAVRFHEEWFGDDQAALIGLLGRVLELDPSAEWAFERLTLLLSVGQRWQDLLALYDRALGSLKDGPRRRKLLLEAAGVAKDFLAEPDRAIRYLDELFQAKPNDPHVSSALERLLEKQGAWDALARVWSTRLPLLAGAEAHELRARIATLRLDRLADAEGALADARHLLAEGGDESVACDLVERVLAFPNASAAARREALGALRVQHERMGRGERVVAALRKALAFADDEERLALLREVVERLAAQGDTAAAMGELVELCRLEPDDPALRTRLRHLAELSGRHDLHVQGLVAAAGATQDASLRTVLLLEAARLEEDVLGAPAAAIERYRRVAADEEVADARRLQALRRLSDRLTGDEDAVDERLDVLARRAELEPALAVRKQVLGELARLATSHRDVERATSAWERRLALDAGDREALDALVDLLAGSARAEQLAAVLRRRAAGAATDEQRRADLVRVAGLQAGVLAAPTAAVETWLEIAGRFGEDGAAVEALRALFARIERWQDLAELLGRAGTRERARLAELCCELGLVFRDRLLERTRAAEWLAQALEADPTHAGARAALAALVDDEGARAVATEALGRAYARSSDWLALLDLLDARLALAPDDAARARLCLEAAELAERQADDLPSALGHLARALTFAPHDPRIEAALIRVGARAQAHGAVADALAAAAARLPETSPRAAELRLAEATVTEHNLADTARAMAAYTAAFRAAPERAAIRLGLVRAAARAGKLEAACEVMLAPPVVPAAIEGELLSALETHATAESSGPPLGHVARALAAALARHPELPRSLARELELKVATWLESQAGANANDEVVAALRRAAAHDPHDRATLERLVEAERRAPGRPLYDALLALAATNPSDYESLAEAADVAERHLGGGEILRQTLRALLDRATAALRAPGPGRGAEAAAVRAIEGLAQLHTATGDRAEIARAIDLVLDATRLPLPAETVKTLRRRAARMALETLGDKLRAREIFRRVVDDDPTDRDARASLATLYEEAELFSDLLALRRRELSLGVPVEQRVALRLELVRVAGLLEERSARVETLLANLEELPGHRATVEQLSDLLAARGKHGELAELLTAQARKVEQSGPPETAAALWTRVATLASESLADVGRSIAAWERVAALDPSVAAFDALANLHGDRGDAPSAASWLEQRLAASVGPDRVAVSLRLARAYLGAGQRHRAIACLERALAEDATAHELRAMLIDLYRQAGAHESLARALAEGCAHLTDRDAIVATAREAATLYQEKLGTPERAIPVLEQALTLVPADRWLRTALAEGLRVAGRTAEARTMLAGLLEEMGRRRSKERAALHYHMALAARADGDLPTALEHLEHAASMDLDHAETQVTLAEVAALAGDLDRAERAYRALLVLARRAEPTEGSVSAAETLLRLQKIAIARGQTDAAAECLDSALATALQSPSEAKRLQAALIARGDGELALSVLEKRRAAAPNAAEEARVLCEMGDVLESLGRVDDALDAFLRAIERAPETELAHERARTASLKAGKPARYLDALTAALEQRRRWDDGPRVCDLLLRAGEVAERDVADARRAAELYARAEETGARPIEVLSAIARTSRALGERAEEQRALRQLARLADEAPEGEQANVLYRLASLQLGDAETRDQGLESLSRALDRAPDFSRALAVVREAGVPDAALTRVMPLYEKVARASGDDRMLLDFLERRAAAPQATQEEVREGVELAVALGENKRAETLLERAVELAGNRPGGMRDAAWALLDLAQRRKAAGDLAGAVKWLEEAGKSSDSPRVPALLREIAKDASASRNGAALAARVYEGLLARNPTDRAIWEPLLSLYATLGDRRGMEQLVSATVERLVNRTERNFLRMAWARSLDGSGTTDEAAGVLRDVLLDEPGHREALMLLAELNERRGDVAEAVSLLSDALREASAETDEAFRATAARKLGDLLRKADPGQAKQVYRTALAAPLSDPELRRSLQSSLLELLSPEDELAERATLLEQVLADETVTGEPAARRAVELADARGKLGDAAAALKALELGRAKAPGNRTIIERLLGTLRERGQWPRVAILLLEEADRTSDPATSADLMRDAARVLRERLGDTTRAAELLRRAFSLAPGDAELLKELTGCLAAMGNTESAIDEVSKALGDSRLDRATRASLLRLRAELRSANGEDAAAVGDLEQAFEIAGDEVATELVDALFRWSARAAAERDVEAERRATFRLAEIWNGRGEPARAQEILFKWVERHPEDHDALRTLRNRFENDGRWDEVAKICMRLVDMEEGDARVEAALGLAHACEEAGHAVEAVPVLEQMLQGHPGQPALLARLAKLYEVSGARDKLAHLMIEQAEATEDPEARFQALTQGAEILLGQGDAATAFTALERAAALHPHDRTVRRLLVDASLAAGLFQEASDAINALLGELRGADPAEVAQLLHRQARAHAGMGDREGQLAALKRALDTDRKNGEVAAEIADIAEEMGDDDLALKALRTITLHAAKGPMTPGIAFFRQARIAFKQGDRQRALIFAKRALQESPGLEDAQELVNQLR